LLVARVAFLLASPAGLSGDAGGYVNVAETIVSSGRLPPMRVQPQGYPVLIAPLLMVAGSQIVQAVLLMNVLMDTAVLVALLLLVRRCLPDDSQRGVRLLACTAIILQPFTAEMASSVLTEQPSQFFVFFGVCALVGLRFGRDGKTPFGVGPLLLGIAGMLRVDLLVLGLVVLIAFYWSRSETFHAFARAATLGTMIYAAVPMSLVAFQYYSSGELGLVVPNTEHGGYRAWMRTWFAFDKEHDRFQFDKGDVGWEGFDPVNYPSRAFGDEDERNRVAKLLADWRIGGYSDTVDRGFQDLARQRLIEGPLLCYIGLPASRMLHYWMNIDGAQTILRVVRVARPLSTIIVGLTVLLKLVILCLAVVGTCFAWKTYLKRTSSDGRPLVELGRMSSITIALRTLELGILGVFLGAGLMEVRYILVVYPFVVALSVLGIHFLTRSRSPGDCVD